MKTVKNFTCKIFYYNLRLKKPVAPIRRIGLFSLHKVFLLFSCVLCNCKIMKNAQILLAILRTMCDSEESTLLFVASLLLRCIKFFYCFSSQLRCLKNCENRAYATTKKERSYSSRSFFSAA